MTTAPKGSPEKKLLTTAIGSLPHHNIDSALQFSFQLGIPFLPQIPIRNSWEYMIPQALEGIPGLQVEPEGSVLLDLDVWNGRSKAFNEKLLSAFSSTTKPDAFEAFEPSSATSSSWQPFLWELEEQNSTLAKIQLAGPLTSQWALRLSDHSLVDTHPEIGTQIFRTVLARTLAMSRRIKHEGIQPFLYLDEPALYALDPKNPKHLLALQELKIMIQALRHEGVWVGLHCCSNTDWSRVLALGIDILSLDVGLSLKSLLQYKDALSMFILGGGRLSLGIIPTSKPTDFSSLDGKALFSELIETLEAELARDLKESKDNQQLLFTILSQAIYTPACGLALLSVSDAESVLAALLEIEALSGSFLK